MGFFKSKKTMPSAMSDNEKYDSENDEAIDSNSFDDKEQEEISLPSNIMLGYYPNVSKKDIKNYLLGLAENHFESLRGSGYAIHKHEKGYLWEIQEGGSQKSIIESVVSLLRNNKEVIIETVDRPVRVLKKKSDSNGLEFYRVNEGDHYKQTDGISYGSNLKPLINSGYKFVYSGTIFFVLGLIALQGSYFNVQYADKKAEYDFREMKYEMPLKQNKKLADHRNNDSYVVSLKFERGKWLLETKTESKKEKSEPEKMISGDDVLIPEINQSDNAMPPMPPMQIQGE